MDFPPEMLRYFLYCAIVRISLAISSGLVMCASMPASRLFCMSSAKALAVIAAIGRIAVSDLPVELLFIDALAGDIIILAGDGDDDILISVRLAVACDQQIVIMHPVLQNPAMHLKGGGSVQPFPHHPEGEHVPDGAALFRVHVLRHDQIERIVVVHVVDRTGIAAAEQALGTKHRDLSGLHIHAEHRRILHGKQIDRARQTQGAFSGGDGT